MASNYMSVEKALIESIHNMDLGLNLTMPNQVENGEGGEWIHINNFRGQSVPVTLGDKGEDKHIGILQADVKTGKGKGAGRVLYFADKIASNYPAGKYLLAGDIKVRVESTTVDSGRIIDANYIVSVSISYMFRTTRRG